MDRGRFGDLTLRGRGYLFGGEKLRAPRGLLESFGKTFPEGQHHVSCIATANEGIIFFFYTQAKEFSRTIFCCIIYRDCKIKRHLLITCNNT